MSSKINIIQDLKQRGLIAQITNQDQLINQLSSKVTSLYCGFDPTADSLHVGHLTLLLCLKRFQIIGHRPIILIGGATGLIGDPSFRIVERIPNQPKKIQKWINKIKKQISLFLNFSDAKNNAVIVNNYHWFSSINILNFLCNVGKYFSVNKMIHKEFIKQRLHSSENTISFTEFSYNLLQAYDFTYLNKKYNVTLQIGGSDQWGNIISGINLTKYMHGQSVYGLTIPLITASDNTKFGKTGKNVIWLDANKTSPYKFYQFWMNTTNENICRFLKFFTFIDIKIIEKLKLTNNITIKKAQTLLANEITQMVHGKHELKIAQCITYNLFSESVYKLNKQDFIQLAKNGISSIKYQKYINLQQALVDINLASSKKQARTLIKSSAIKINGKKQTKIEYIFNNADRVCENYTLIQRGKKNFFLIHWI